MGLETQLRESMLSHADAAPAGAGLLEGVRLRQRRFQRRRWAAVTAGFAVVLAVTAVPLLAGGIWQGPVAALPPPSPATADLEMPYFPYEITWMPPGAGEVEVNYHHATGITAQAQVMDGQVSVLVMDRPFPLLLSAPHVEVDTVVDGRPAKQRTGPRGDNIPWVALSWERDGRWVTVYGQYSVTSADVRRIAEGLRPGRIEIRTPIRLRLTDGWEIFRVDGNLRLNADGELLARPRTGLPFSFVCLYRLDTAKEGAYRGLCINADKSWPGVPEVPPAKKVVVNGGDGWVIPVDSVGPRLVFRTGGWTITVDHGRGLGLGLGPLLTGDELIRFAEGISIVDP